MIELTEYEKERGKPPPTFNHGVVEARLAGAFASDPRFSVLPELTLELPDGSCSTPDISVYPPLQHDWEQDIPRMNALPRLVVEIQSPFQPWQQICDRIDRYHAHGVESVWVVQTWMQTIAIFLPGADRPLVFAAGKAKDPVTGLTARLEEVFA